MKTIEAVPTSSYFELKQIKEGIYAAIIKDGKGAWGNAGIIDLGDKTLVFDTFLTPKAAFDLREKAELLTGKPVTYVVNSHWHIDHCLGNQVFDGAKIISTKMTRDMLATRMDFSDVNAMQTGLKKHIIDLEKEAESEEDPLKKAALLNEIIEKTHYFEAIPTIQKTLPTLTFESRLEIVGTSRKAQLLSFGGGHTPSDAFLYLPHDRIAFMGDLVFVRTQPTIHVQPPQKWLNILSQVKEMDIDIVIPGHGPIGTMKDVEQTQEYLKDLLNIVTSFLAQGGAKQGLSSLTVPNRYKEWAFPHVFTWNVNNVWSLLGQTSVM